jgi:hypothetical protein
MVIRFSISVAAYSFVSTFVIIFQMNFKYRRNDISCVTNATRLGSHHANCFRLYPTICDFLEIFVVVFLTSLVHARWFLPNSIKLSKDQIYQQISFLTSAAADIIDISDLMQNERIIESQHLMKLLQAAFILSIVQFSFSVAATQKRNSQLKGRFSNLINLIFSTEAWSLILAILSQELPCFIVRIFIINHFKSKISFSLYFFVIKNGLMVLLYFYRIVLLINQDYADSLVIPCC